MEHILYGSLDFLLRLAHVVAGISWIGSSFYFIWVDRSLSPRESSEGRILGELWMVHSGGFYQVLRRKIGPGQIPKTLHWFKWEAAWTWITGIFLLGLVYYSADGALLFDASRGALNCVQAGLVFLGTLILSWIFYDIFCQTPLGGSFKFSALFFFSMFCVLSYGLCKFFGGRAAYIHMGVVLGTIMVANVWMRILPAQRQMILATEKGKPADFTLGEKAKVRSVHNSYITLPVILLMVSNHYPFAYGHELNWIILIFLFIIGASVRHLMIGHRKSALLSLFLVLSACLAVFLITRPSDESNDLTADKGMPHTDPHDRTGTLKGYAIFKGPTPNPKQIKVSPECQSIRKHPLMSESLTVHNGRVLNAFIWIGEGLEGNSFPILSSEVIIDQQGCAYVPHVVGLQVGQALTFLNSDAVFHNVHPLAKINSAFNLGMATKNMRITRKFTKQEVMIHTRCDVHPWMSSYIGVVSHPFFSVTGDGGAFKIENVPVGKYVVKAWHETLGTKQSSVTVSENGIENLEFEFQ